MDLQTSWKKLDDEFSSLSSHIRDYAAKRPLIGSPSDFSVLDECMLEGLLSRAWQAWCLFCRSCVVDSCIGTVNLAGNSIAGLPDATSEAHVSGAALRAKQNKAQPPFWGQTNTELRHEPTWGDVDVLTKLVVRLQPTNSSQLLAAFSSGHISAKRLQTIRNSAAHDNHQTLANVHQLSSAFQAFVIGHPTHALFWIHPNTSDFLITQSMQELVVMGRDAIS